MTETNCWVEFKSDRALQRKITEGWFSTAEDKEGESCFVPIMSFPPHPNQAFWPGVVREWCKLRGLQWDDTDGATTIVRVKQEQIRDFIEYVYADAPFYTDPSQMLTWKGCAHLANRLTNLRAFVAQELNPRLWYELNADTY